MMQEGWGLCVGVKKREQVGPGSGRSAEGPHQGRQEELRVGLQGGGSMSLNHCQRPQAQVRTGSGLVLSSEIDRLLVRFMWNAKDLEEAK